MNPVDRRAVQLRLEEKRDVVDRDLESFVHISHHVRVALRMYKSKPD